MIDILNPKLLTHPLVAIITGPVAWMLWSIAGFSFSFQQITDFCALAFTYWTILVLLGWKVKIPKGFYLLGSLYLAVLGTITLTTHQPFFSFPTLVHLTEAILGFGYFSIFFKNKTRIIFLASVVLVLFLAHFFYQSRGSFLAPVEMEKRNMPSSAGENVCGNDLCEPDLGESKETCPKDCSARD